MFIPEGMTFGLAKEIIDASPVFAQERPDRRAAGDGRDSLAATVDAGSVELVVTAKPGTIEG
jgi:hypothetical protein